MMKMSENLGPLVVASHFTSLEIVTEIGNRNRSMLARHFETQKFNIDPRGIFKIVSFRPVITVSIHVISQPRIIRFHSTAQGAYRRNE